MRVGKVYMAFNTAHSRQSSHAYRVKIFLKISELSVSNQSDQNKLGEFQSHDVA